MTQPTDPKPFQPLPSPPFGPPPPGFSSPAPQPAPKRKRRWPWIIAAVGVLFILLCGGLIAALGGGDGGAPTAAGPTSPGAYEEPTTPAAAATTQPQAVATTKPAAPPKPAPVTVDDGTWVVGEDIPAGTYRTTEAVAGMDCYWAILKSGTNGEVIISNDLPSGGFPRVTVRKGQDFETNRCGVWQKIR